MQQKSSILTDASSFDYQATNPQGALVRGRVEAPSEQVAFRRLRDQGLVPVEILPARVRLAEERNDRRLTLGMRKQVLQELGTLLQAGVPLSEALQSLRQGHADTPLGDVFSRMYDGLRRGDTFSQALEKSRLELPPDIRQIIRAGESRGELAEAVGLALEQMAYMEANRQELRNALIYPAILVITGVAAVALIFALVVPRFSRLLEQGGDAIPWLSRVVLSLGLYMHDHWLVVLGAVAVMGVLIWGLLQQVSGRRFLEAGLLRAPLFGAWMHQTQMARWTRTLGSLLASHVSLSQALSLSLDAVSVSSLRKKLENVHAQVRGGERLTESLEAQGLIDPMGANLLRVGEQSSALASMLLALAKVYNDQSRQRMKRFLLLLEPVAILFIGASIGVLMVAIMLAITSVSDIAL